MAQAAATTRAGGTERTLNNDASIEIRDTAIKFGLVSDYTAFIAVDSSRRTKGDHGVSTKVPVPVPAGVPYDTTVEEK